MSGYVISYTKEVIKKLKPGDGMTIRPVGKRVYKVGDRLYHYTGPYRPGERVKIGESTISEVVPITIKCLKDTPCANEIKITPKRDASAYVALAQADGFESLFDFNSFFIKTYKLKPGDWEEFNIIKWIDFVGVGG